jgi:hypothetical protein
MKPSIIALSITLTSLAPSAAVERPGDAHLHAYKAYHHAIYLKATAEEAGGTNRTLQPIASSYRVRFRYYSSALKL